MNVNLYLDCSPLVDLPEAIQAEVSQHNLVSNIGGPKVSFCGMLRNKNEVSIFLPRATKLQGLGMVEKISIASDLLRAVELYGRQSKTAVHISDEGEGRVGVSQLSLIRRLLLSYRQNGLYARRRCISRINIGKPNWKATVAAGNAFPTRNGKPIYLDIIGSKRRYFFDSEVSRIHAYVIRYLDEAYSWIFTGKARLIAPELKDIQPPIGSVPVMQALLKRELRLTYSDNDISLLKALIEYLEQMAGEKAGSSISGLKSFHYAWEHMLHSVLTNTFSINNVLPAPSYEMTDGSYSDAFASSMKVDIALKDPHDRTVAIVDAKYYSAMNTTSAPGWPDLVKQFFYEKAFRLIEPNYKLRNAFIFPGQDGPLKSVHLKSKRDGTFFDKEFIPISCHYVNPRDVVQHYIKNKKMVDLSNLLLAS